MPEQHIDHRVDEIITLLSDAMKVRKPKWEWCERRVSQYRIREETIRLSRRDWHGIEDALLHEFAHHVTWVRNRTCYHDLWFCQALAEAVELWYSNVKRYGWNKEYATVQAYAVRKGYIQPTWLEFRVGQCVSWRQGHLRGTVHRVNHKTITIRTEDGGLWKVHRAAANVIEEEEV